MLSQSYLTTVKFNIVTAIQDPVKLRTSVKTMFEGHMSLALSNSIPRSEVDSNVQHEYRSVLQHTRQSYLSNTCQQCCRKQLLCRYAEANITP
jgi:hypothetical protein